jgi:hypothetical protein
MAMLLPVLAVVVSSVFSKVKRHWLFSCFKTTNTSDQGLSETLHASTPPPYKQFQDINAKDSRLNNLFLIVFALYPFLTSRIAHMMACKTYGEEIFQRYDFHVQCDDPKYLIFLYVAWLCVVLCRARSFGV